MDSRRVVIVGGGVIGTMHALEAVRRGWEVIHLEADAGPRRASVRNFGLVWVSGRAAGEELELGLRAQEAVRRGWEVIHLEADAGPRRASVRNFGLVWVSGRAAGEELELGLRA